MKLCVSFYHDDAWNEHNQLRDACGISYAFDLNVRMKNDTCGMFEVKVKPSIVLMLHICTSLAWLECSSAVYVYEIHKSLWIEQNFVVAGMNKCNIYSQFCMP